MWLRVLEVSEVKVTTVKVREEACLELRYRHSPYSLDMSSWVLYAAWLIGG